MRILAWIMLWMAVCPMLLGEPTLITRYVDTDIGNNGNDGTPEWAIRHATWPQQSAASWGSKYRVTAGRVCSSTALCALIMDAKGLWNHNAYFDYTDRYMQHYEPGSPNAKCTSRSTNRCGTSIEPIIYLFGVLER